MRVVLIVVDTKCAYYATA